MMNLLKNALREVVDTAIFIESVFHKKQNDSQKRVLILRKDGLGDCLLFFPYLKDLKEYYKDAEVTLIFPAYFKDLAPVLDQVDKVIWFDHGRFSKSFLYRRKFLLNLKKEGFDIVMYPVYTRELMGDFMMKLTGAREIIGFDTGPKEPYTRLINVPDDIKSELERNALFVENIIGKVPRIVFPTIDTNKLQSTEVEALLLDLKEPFVVVFPGAGASYRIWPHNRFARVIEHLIQKGVNPVVCGSSKEMALTSHIISLVSESAKDKILDLTGKTDLRELAQILKKAQFYFGSDTGILHLATAVGTRAIAIVGSGSIGRFFPYGDRDKNIALYNPKIKPTGGWDKERVNEHSIHPSIESIPLESAIKNIDFMIESTK
jgi:heptosyltransferase I